MGNFFKDFFRSKKPSRKDQYGIVLITNDPDKEVSKYKKDLDSIMRYPQIVKSYHVSSQSVKELAPDLKLPKSPAFALIREGIDSASSFGHRLENAIICTEKLTELILFIELVKQEA